MEKILLGCIADDFTGATDLANNLVRAGMRVVQTIGVPDQPLDAEADAVVVALKSRTVPAAEAIEQSLAALRWLQAQGVQQIYFKYCSTFDSTAGGNIGPVTEALMAALGTNFTIATPAFPDNKRTVFKGYLFVGDVLLNESGMQNHPLTPMCDANLVRVLQAQTSKKVGLIDHVAVAQGDDAVRARIAELQAQGVAIAIVDAVSNADLLRLGPALKDMPLLTAGSGVAIALPANFGIAPSVQAAELPTATGLQAIVSGSCSVATNQQVMDFIQSGRPALAIDPLRISAGVDVAAEALAWADQHIASGPMLVYSTAEPGAVRAIQGQLGVEQAGAMVEQTIAAIARGLVERGVRQLIVAGGETSGACVQALGIAQLRIGGQIDPGVPWCFAASDVAPDGLHLTLKSGNFGSVDFFSKAFAQLRRMSKFMDEDQARAEICRVGRSLFERGYVHATAGNISVRLADGFLITPTDACLGTLQAGRLARLDAQGQQLSGDRASKTMQLHRRIYAASEDARCVIHTHSTHLVACSLRADPAEAELLPPLTPYFVMKVGHVPHIAYHRPGAPEAAEAVAQAITRYAAAGTPVRAVMLARLGPNVWHDSPAAAMAVLEELEETAKLHLLAPAAPLGADQIDELRRVFGAHW